MKHKSESIILNTLIITTLCSGIVLGASTVSADDDSVVDDVSITVPVSCSMTGNGMDSHTASIENGRYVPDIGTTTLKAFCNDNEGFAIYAAGYTGEEVGGENSTKLVGTPTGIGNIDTGIAESGNNSNWAMKLTVKTDSGDTTTNPITIDSAPNTDGGADASFSQYHIIPSTYTKVAHKNSATDMTANTGGATLETTYAAYISSTQTAGTYAGKVIYTLVHPSEAAAPVVPVTIEDAYKKAGKTKLNGHYKIQDMNSTICNNVNQYSADGMAEVVDERDNNIYHIAKLADDRCWMLDNLALDPTDPTTAQNMNENNTNATTAAITNLLNGGSSTTGWSSVAVVKIDEGFRSVTTPEINNTSKDTLVTSYGPASTNGQAKVGIYYNYCAASASTYCYEYAQGVDTPGTDIDASQDLCPANWRMPTSGSTGEYQVLAQEYAVTEDATDPNSLQYNLSTPLSGYYYHFSSALYQNSYGFWWSSTYSEYSGGVGMYYLTVFPDHLNPADQFSGGYGNSRSYGNTVRCLVGE